MNRLAVTVRHALREGYFSGGPIKQLIFSRVLVWRPVCLCKLYAHCRKAYELNAEVVFNREVEVLNETRTRILVTRASGVRFIVVSLATMIWEPWTVAWALEEFI